MEIKDVMTRLGKVRSEANLSAREVSLRIGKSGQYLSQIESGRITLSVETLLDILKVCNCSEEKFFSENFESFNEDKQLKALLNSLPQNKKKSLIEFLSK